MRFSFRLLCVVLFVASVLSGRGQSFVIPSTDKSFQLNGFITYLPDSSGMSFDEALRTPFVKSILTEFYQDEKMVFWMKVSLANQTTANQFVITIDQWNEAEVFYFSDNQWRSMVSGTSTPVENRPLSLHRLLSFPMVIAPHETKEIIIKARITDPLMRYYANLFSFVSKIELDEASNAYRKYIGNQLLVMFILGVTFILFLYNLILYFFEHQRTSFILALYFITISLVIANTHGITTNHLFTGITAFEMHLALHLAHLTPIIIASFLMSYFKLYKKQWEGYLLGVFIAFMIFSWIYSVSTQQSFFFFARRYLEYATFVTVLTSCMIKKRPGAVILFAAILVTIAAGYFAELRSVFFANVNFVGPDTPYLVSVFIQVVIFSFAATYRVKNLQRGVYEMQVAQQQLVEQQNENLRTQVEEKTRQLQQALQTLQQQKDQLEQINEELSVQSQSVSALNSQLEVLVKNRTEALEATMRDLDTFLYRTSHDLRRPLMTILGINNLILKERDFTTIAELTALTTRTVNELDRMLKKLIAISLSYSEKMDIDTFQLHDLLDSVQQTCLRENPDRTVTIRVLPATAFTIASNTHILTDVLKSIIENSIQYGAKSVEIAVEKHANHGIVIILIRDDGPGIEKIYQERVFEMFFRADEKSTGNGLGLYLAKIGTQRLGGQVSLMSTVGEGTTVKITLPLA